MPTTTSRHVWLMAASLAATAVLSFAVGVMTTVWALSDPQLAAHRPVPRKAEPALAALDSTPDRLRYAMVPATRVGAAEAAAVAPEHFGELVPVADDLADSDADAGAFTLELGMFMLAERAEEVRQDAEALGIASSTRLIVDGEGRAWYVVHAGRFPDRVSAEMMARSFDGAHAVPLRAARWSRG